MSADYKPRTGDRVRVVLEGEANGVGSSGFVIGESYDDNFIAFGAKHVVSIEKIEPPVTVFKPGQTVRLRSRSGLPPLTYSIGNGGYYSHHGKKWFTHEEARTHEGYFTSRQYELVELK